MKNSYVQALIIIVAAAVLALASNAMAGRQRKLVLPGYYPAALTVPPRVVETPPAAGETVGGPSSPSPGQTETFGAPVSSPAPGGTTPPAPSAARNGGAPQKPAGAPQMPAPVNLLERFPPHPDKPYVEIGGDAVALLHANGALFLDARRTSVFEEGHIAGARPFSVWESDVDEKVNRLFEERGDPDQQLQPIVIYCSGGACEDSHMLAQKLWGVQFNNVLVYSDGYPDWLKRSGAVRKGGTP
ncbi:MAG TPA: rhodanese-like domain-containing protein [Thermoanaerobaculia bacterium]|nr:rhodanese-like domain-containing protein [Thermoanaerobaculia bacterium]